MDEPAETEHWTFLWSRLNIFSVHDQPTTDNVIGKWKERLMNFNIQVALQCDCAKRNATALALWQLHRMQLIWQLHNTVETECKRQGVMITWKPSGIWIGVFNAISHGHGQLSLFIPTTGSTSTSTRSSYNIAHITQKSKRHSTHPSHHLMGSISMVSNPRIE